MTGTLAPPRAASPSAPQVRTLRPANVIDLRLPGPRGGEALRHVLRHDPGRSVWIPETLEYAIIGSWRNRPEIASVDELVATRGVEPLLRAAFERCITRGDELLLTVELDTQRGTSRFERAGMELLEEVITYEIDLTRVPLRPPHSASLIPVHASNYAAIEHITRLDQRAFPWLWRNSSEEFAVYLETPGVDVSIVSWDGRPVAYVGTTLFTGWGHLDRIAVEPELQGRGFGKAALTLAIESLRRRGARRVGLSTQRSNTRSQRLYERFGFMRTPELDYQLFGYWNRAVDNRSG